MTDKLLPCPFCGGESRVGQDTSSDYERHWRWFAECLNYDNCGVELIGFSTREQAVTAWNRRTSLYSHRNGETAPPAEPGRYWFRGDVTGEITGRYAVAGIVDAYRESCYNDVCGETLHFWNYAGQWWGPIAAPWESEAE